MAERHVPARVWTLARLAAEHGWEVNIDPDEDRCDVGFRREVPTDEWVALSWLIEDGRGRLEYATYQLRSAWNEGDPYDIRLKDVPAILRGAS